MKTLTLLDQVVPITADIEAAFLEHDAFCSMGQARLLAVDPSGEREGELLDALWREAKRAFDQAIAHLPEDEQDDLMDQYDDSDLQHEIYDQLVEIFDLETA